MGIKDAVEAAWSGEGPPEKTGPLREWLRLLSFPYGRAIRLRNRLYDRGLLCRRKLPCPVISVGNLTVGGTGKTPTVIFLANLLKERGCRPAVLSRGYGGRAKSPVNVVSDGSRIRMGWRDAGDEPVLIAGAAPGVPVLTGSRRFLTGQAAIGRFGADILILDDAFQHRALFRDLDIVLVDAKQPFGNGFILPGGPLREAPEALGRAHLLIRTGTDEEPYPLPASAADLPSFRGIHRPLGIVHGGTGRVSPLAELHRRKVFAFAGIGRPEAFYRSLTGLGAEVACLRVFPDHHPYSRNDLDTIERLARQNDSEWIVTTEKDAVRLADHPAFLARLSLLRIGMEISPAEPFADLILSRIAGRKGLE